MLRAEKLHLHHIVRHAGNKSLHVDDEPDDVLVLVLDEGNTEIGPLIFEVVNQSVDEQVTKPAMAKNLVNSLPDGVREAIERRAAKRDTKPLVLQRGGPRGARTHDPRIKSPMLCQLS